MGAADEADRDVIIGFVIGFIVIGNFRIDAIGRLDPRGVEVTVNANELRRSGYTILELMISLVLMATLMMVAWSILGSYRDAEQRGWNQTYQMQVIRIARQWLQTDADSLMEPPVQTSSPTDPLQSFSSTSEMTPFKGDEQGFEVDVMPSVDPLAWIQEVTRADEPLTTTTQALEATNSNTAIAIDPLAVHRLRYTIVGNMPIDTTSTETDEEFFDLQRELIPIDRWSHASSSPSPEKLLTTEDLYRVGEDELLTDSASAVKSPVASLRNLITPRFRYSDGKQWLSQWDSQLKGGLPRAIELSFDLPSASTDYERIEPEADETGELIADDFTRGEFSTENLVSVAPPAVELDGDAALTRDVRIVVLVAGSAVQGARHE